MLGAGGGVLGRCGLLSGRGSMQVEYSTLAEASGIGHCHHEYSGLARLETLKRREA
jgi:hypothetical protein